MTADEGWCDADLMEAGRLAEVKTEAVRQLQVAEQALEDEVLRLREMRVPVGALASAVDEDMREVMNMAVAAMNRQTARKETNE